jgi:hypothetical protein
MLRSEACGVKYRSHCVRTASSNGIQLSGKVVSGYLRPQSPAVHLQFLIRGFFEEYAARNLK